MISPQSTLVWNWIEVYGMKQDIIFRYKKYITLLIDHKNITSLDLNFYGQAPNFVSCILFSRNVKKFVCVQFILVFPSILLRNIVL